jgi:hypothetical protein
MEAAMALSDVRSIKSSASMFFGHSSNATKQFTAAGQKAKQIAAARAFTLLVGHPPR